MDIMVLASFAKAKATGITGRLNRELRRMHTEALQKQRTAPLRITKAFPLRNACVTISTKKSWFLILV
jgi:hypothetical protein